MKKAKLFISFLLVSLLLFAQISTVSAAPAKEQTDLHRGRVQEITLRTDASTGVTTVQVTLVDQNKKSQTLRISLETAADPAVGLVMLDENGPLINADALGQEIEIDPADVIPDEEDIQHPIASALATYFSTYIPGLEYEAIMSAHEDGHGFGVIAQALWLTRKLGGDADDLARILAAKKTGDFGDFSLSDGSTPLNWGQFRKAVMSGDPNHLGVVISNGEDHGNNGAPVNGGNNGNGNANGHGNNNNGNRENHGNGNANKNRP